MKTILFIDKRNVEVWESFRRYDYILDEYAARGMYAVCDWHSDGRSVRATIPDLEKLVGSNEQWRAIVVCDLRSKGVELEEDIHFDNPFDFPESYALDNTEPVVESDRPIIRLTQMLGGFPEKAAAQWSEWLQGSYEGKAVAEAERVASQDLMTPPKLGDVKVLLPQAEDKYEMLNRYRLSVLRPVELICITPREVDLELVERRKADFVELQRRLEDERAALLELGFLVEHYREQGLTEEQRRQKKDELEALQLELQQHEQAIDFWQRNNYPPIVRFIVCDRRAGAIDVGEADDESAAQAENLRMLEEVLPEKEQVEVHEPDDWFQFWICVLSLVTSDIAPDNMRPFVVHSISANVNNDEFGKVFSKRYTEWVAVRGLIEEELAIEERRLIPSEYEMAELPDCQSSIGVVFDLVDESNLYADRSAMGFFRDDPDKDELIWTSQKKVVFEEFRRLLRAPARGVSLGVTQFRATNSLSQDELDACVMNSYQCAEMADNLQEIEYALGRDVSPMAFEMNTYRQTIEDGGKSILKAAEKRTNKSQAFIAIGVACAALLIGFLPYCFGAHGGVATNPSAWLVAIASCLILAIVAVITLARMRDDVRSAYEEFNHSIGSILSNLHTEASRIGKRMSSYATFKKSWSLLNRQKRRNKPTQRTIWLGKQDTMLRTRMADIEALSSSVSVDYDSYCDIQRKGWDCAAALLDNPAFFNISDADCVTRPLNKDLPSQATVEVPYSFISDIRLVQVDVS